MMRRQITLVATIAMLGSAVPHALAHEHEEKPATSTPKEHSEGHHVMRMHHERMRALHESRMEGYLANKIDTDQDGVVTYDEFMANAKTRFEATDLNDDGIITVEERRESAEIMRKKHREAMLQAKESRMQKRESMRKEARELLRKKDVEAKDSP